MIGGRRTLNSTVKQVDSRELSSQDVGSIRCCESPHSIVCLLQGKSYLLIYTYTYNYCAYFIHEQHNKNTTPLTYRIGSARQPAGRCESAGCSSPASGGFLRCPVPMATLHSWCLSSCWHRCHHHGQRWWCVPPCPVGGHKVGRNMILNAQSTVEVILGRNDLLHHKWMPCWGSQGSQQHNIECLVNCEVIIIRVKCFTASQMKATITARDDDVFCHALLTSQGRR